LHARAVVSPSPSPSGTFLHFLFYRVQRSVMRCNQCISLTLCSSFITLLATHVAKSLFSYVSHTPRLATHTHTRRHHTARMSLTLLAFLCRPHTRRLDLLGRSNVWSGSTATSRKPCDGRRRLRRSVLRRTSARWRTRRDDSRSSRPSERPGEHTTCTLQCVCVCVCVLIGGGGGHIRGFLSSSCCV
jgi:hypothetical protein